MNIKHSAFYHQAIVGMVRAVTAPTKERLNDCIKIATDSKNSLLLEIERFIMDQADELAKCSKEDFDKYFQKHISDRVAEIMEEK